MARSPIASHWDSSGSSDRKHLESLTRMDDCFVDRLSYREETVAIMHELTRLSDEVARAGGRTRRPSR